MRLADVHHKLLMENDAVEQSEPLHNDECESTDNQPVCTCESDVTCYVSQFAPAGI